MHLPPDEDQFLGAEHYIHLLSFVSGSYEQREVAFYVSVPSPAHIRHTRKYKQTHKSEPHRIHGLSVSARNCRQRQKVARPVGKPPHGANGA